MFLKMPPIRNKRWPVIESHVSSSCVFIIPQPWFLGVLMRLVCSKEPIHLAESSDCSHTVPVNTCHYHQTHNSVDTEMWPEYGSGRFTVGRLSDKLSSHKLMWIKEALMHKQLWTVIWISRKRSSIVMLFLFLFHAAQWIDRKNRRQRQSRAGFVHGITNSRNYEMKHDVVLCAPEETAVDKRSREVSEMNSTQLFLRTGKQQYLQWNIATIHISFEVAPLMLLNKEFIILQEQFSWGSYCRHVEET